MEETKPLFRILPDKWFIKPDATRRDILNVILIDFVIMRQMNFCKINMQFAVFHVINAGEDRCATAQAEDSGTFGAGQWTVEKFYARAAAGVALIEADDE